MLSCFTCWQTVHTFYFMRELSKTVFEAKHNYMWFKQGDLAYIIYQFVIDKATIADNIKSISTDKIIFKKETYRLYLPKYYY